MPPEVPNQEPSPQQMPSVARLPRMMRDPRLGFRRQFTSMAPQSPAAQPTTVAPMGQELFDDPYYRHTVNNTEKKHKRLVLVVVIAVLLLLGVGSAVALPIIKKHNPNGLFVNAEAGRQ